MNLTLEKRIIRQSFPKLSEKDLQVIFNMYPHKGQIDSRLTIAHARHMELEYRYSTL
jgi:hypothetical protein